jgi:hypothetical protein
MNTVQMAGQEKVEKFLDSCPAGHVLKVSEYSPNGSPSQWQGYITADQEVDCDTEEAQDYSMTLSEDATRLETAYTPARSKHTYRSYEWVPAIEYKNEIIDAFAGEGYKLEFGDLANFAGFLETNLDMDSDCDGYKELLANACEIVAENLRN